MNHSTNVRNRNIDFTFPFPEKFMAKGWGATHEYNTLEIQVSYATGGMNNLSGTSSPRGYWLYFSPCNLSIERGFETRETVIGTGNKLFLAPSERYSEKTLKTWAAKVEPHAKALAEAYVKGEKETVINLFAQVCEFDGPPKSTIKA